MAQQLPSVDGQVLRPRTRSGFLSQAIATANNRPHAEALHDSIAVQSQNRSTTFARPAGVSLTIRPCSIDFQNRSYSNHSFPHTQGGFDQPDQRRKQEGLHHSAPHSTQTAVKFGPSLVKSIDGVNQNEKKIWSITEKLLEFTGYH
jgi:hypothetical protein